ncbi:hypothetical protein EHR08_19625 [Leptospira bandrabouensis]|uniref:Uncharacterized protein n=1 Tax=Leptospira bandrabouensis TaxID=2484903 RepID=A0A6H3NMN4_9LEPT|nr:hypothetical protein EHR08_19625 [Leptospira bandrabouensis]
MSSCHSLAYASYVPVPNVPFRDSGSDNFGKASSLIAMSKKKEFKIFFLQIFAESFYSMRVKREMRKRKN